MPTTQNRPSNLVPSTPAGAAGSNYNNRMFRGASARDQKGEEPQDISNRFFFARSKE
ncbi:unnamed protein product, partial [Amoebophrya sp. A25]|eukprot:GSA25T00014611001.1